MSENPSTPGWYPSQQDATTEIYWDGSVWTQQMRPSHMTVICPDCRTPNRIPTAATGRFQCGGCGVLLPSTADLINASPPVGGSATVRPQHPENGRGVAALILGIVGLILPIPLIPSLLALILGKSGQFRADSGRATNGGVALAGAILGGIGVILWGIVIVIVIVVALMGNDLSSNFDEIASTISP